MTVNNHKVHLLWYFELLCDIYRVQSLGEEEKVASIWQTRKAVHILVYDVLNVQPVIPSTTPYSGDLFEILIEEEFQELEMRYLKPCYAPYISRFINA